MDFKCFLFAAFFLVACVAFSSQDELTDVEGKSKSILFKIMFLSPFHHSTFIVSTMFSTKKQQKLLTTTIYRAKKSAFTIFYFILNQCKDFFPIHTLIFSFFVFIFKHRHSNKQRTMVNEYSYYHHFFSMSALYLSFNRWKILSKKSLAFALCFFVVVVVVLFLCYVVWLSSFCCCFVMLWLQSHISMFASNQ